MFGADPGDLAHLMASVSVTFHPAAYTAKAKRALLQVKNGFPRCPLSAAALVHSCRRPRPAPAVALRCRRTSP